MAILDHTFLEAYPIHVGRKHFFDACQKEGLSAIEFSEELLSLLEEADGVNITCNDLICMMLQIGLSDLSLQRELGAIRNPTILEHRNLLCQLLPLGMPIYKFFLLSLSSETQVGEL